MTYHSHVKNPTALAPWAQQSLPGVNLRKMAKPSGLSANVGNMCRKVPCSFLCLNVCDQKTAALLRWSKPPSLIQLCTQKPASLFNCIQWHHLPVQLTVYKKHSMLQGAVASLSESLVHQTQLVYVSSCFPYSLIVLVRSIPGEEWHMIIDELVYQLIVGLSLEHQLPDNDMWTSYKYESLALA